MKHPTRYASSASAFACPVCKASLALAGTSLVCPNKHCYDIAKSGYVNLVLSSPKQTNYDKHSFENRHFVLEQGLYQPILDALVHFVSHEKSIERILDVGCGEGYYAKHLRQQTGKSVFAFDLSKDSIQLAAKKDTDALINWFVADLSAIPLQDGCIDCILDIFSPANYKEFHRILAPNGYVIKVVPTANHLLELRQKAKDYLLRTEYSNQSVIDYFENSFSCISRKTISHRFALSDETRSAFIEMTPLLFHVDKTRVDWSDITHLTIEADTLVGVRHDA